MRQLSVSKPSSEGPSLAARTVLTTGYAPIVSRAPASPAQRLLRDRGTHSHPLSHRERDCSRKKIICKTAGLGAGFGARMSWPTLQRPRGQAVPQAAGGVEIEAADMWKKEPAPKGVWSSLLGKAREKPRKAASQGGRGTFLDAILFLMLTLNNKAEGLRHSNKSLWGWSKQPLPTLSSSEHRTTAADLVLASPLKGEAVAFSADSRGPREN